MHLHSVNLRVTMFVLLLAGPNGLLKTYPLRFRGKGVRSSGTWPPPTRLRLSIFFLMLPMRTRSLGRIVAEGGPDAAIG